MLLGQRATCLSFGGLYQLDTDPAGGSTNSLWCGFDTTNGPFEAAFNTNLGNGDWPSIAGNTLGILVPGRAVFSNILIDARIGGGLDFTAVQVALQFRPISTGTLSTTTRRKWDSVDLSIGAYTNIVNDQSPFVVPETGQLFLSVRSSTDTANTNAQVPVSVLMQ